VLVPETVLDELERGPTDISGLEFSTVQLDIDTESVYPYLDSGERAALIVRTERDAIHLTDGLDARNAAGEEGIEVHGSVGVVLYGYSQEALSSDAAKRSLRGLNQETNRYLSTPLIEHAIESVESDEAGW
jgi:predicted nucleic acid-binding protein